MMEEENESKDLKLYSQRAIGIATFIGSPLAAGYLIRENFLSLQQPKKAKNAFIIGLVATIILFVAIFTMPESIIDRVPNQIIPLIYTAIIYLIVEKIHGSILKQHKENGNVFHSAWKAAGVGLVALLIITLAIVGYAFLGPDDSNRQYDTEIATFSKNEKESMLFYDHLETRSNDLLLHELENSTIPKWQENIEIIQKLNQMPDLPAEVVKQNQILLQYAELRLKAFELYHQSIREDTRLYDAEINKLHAEMDEQIDKLD